MKFKRIELTEKQLKVLSSAKQPWSAIPLIIDVGASTTKGFKCNAAASKIFIKNNILTLACNSITVEEEQLNTTVTIKLIDSELKIHAHIEGESFASVTLKANTKCCVSDISPIDELVATNLSRLLKPNQLENILIKEYYSCCILKKPQEYISLISGAQRLYNDKKLLTRPSNKLFSVNKMRKKHQADSALCS